MFTLNSVEELAHSIKAAGGKAFLVGGFVRDRVLGKESKDFDLEVFGLEPSKLKQILETFAAKHGERVKLVGESFQVFKIGLNLDVSLPRRDRKTGEGHKGFEVTADPHMDSFEASRRRDFTMNAMLLDPLTAHVVDHFNGLYDIKAKIVQMVDPNTFVEDSLRALRAVQFASRFEFSIGTRTWEVIKTMDLRDLPRERVWMEVEKGLMLSPKPSFWLFLMQQTGILEKLFPEVEKLVRVPQDQRWHPEGDVFVHTALALDVAKEVSRDLPYAEQVAVMLGTLCHDLGKFETTKVQWAHRGGYVCADYCNISDLKELTDYRCADDATGELHRITAHGHAEAGVSLARNVLDRLAIHSIEGYDVRSQVLALVEHHLAPFAFFKQQPKDSAFRRLATHVDLNLLHKVARADAESRNNNNLGVVFGTEAQDWFLSKIANLAIPPQGPEKILLGRHLLDLGMKPSKAMGEIIAKVFEAQLEGTVTNLDEALELAKLEILEQNLANKETI